MNSRQIEQKDPMTLRPCRLLKLVPELAEDDDRFIALVDDVRERGIDHPLIVTGDGLILDGRHLWRAAKRLQLATVPCVTRSEEDAAGIVLNSLVQRRHFTKGALAYIAYPLLEPVLAASKARRMDNLKSVEKANNPRSSAEQTIGKISHFSPKTAEEVAAHTGFGRELFFFAKRLHEVFAKSDQAVAEYRAAHPGWEPSAAGVLSEGPWDLRGQWEPKILAGETGLGAALAGIAGEEATRGKDKQTSGQLELFEEGFELISKRFSYWERFTDGQRVKARAVIRATVEQMPEELRREMERAIRSVEKSKAAA